MKISVPLLLFLTCVVSCTHSPKSAEQKSLVPVLSTWTEYEADSQVHARAVVTTSECPKLNVEENGKPAREIVMAERAPRSADFPQLVCDSPLPAEAIRASVLGHEFALPHKDINKIIVIGDTGCRLRVFNNGGAVIQACGSASDWPFKIVADAAASFAPDVVIHVGDYHYRESQCPDGNPKCATVGIPETSGDRWESWNEDFLTPASNLLQKAPWIFVRGNHELCPRGGIGWNTVLSPFPYSTPCGGNMEPYVVKLADQRFIIADVADDANEDPSFKKLVELVHPTEFSWLFLHRPFLTPGADNEAKNKGSLPKALLKPGLLNLVVTGHVHTLSIDQFDDARPPEVITGNSGTKLDQRSFSGLKGVKVTPYSDFGFLALTRKNADEWKRDVNDRNGKPVWLCDLKQSHKKKTHINCQPAVSLLSGCREKLRPV